MRANLVTQLKEHIPEVAEQWQAIQAAVAKINSEERAAEKAEKQAEEAKWTDARKVFVDEGVVKYVFSEPDEGAASPKDGDMITAHYTGTLEDGTKFDSSVDRGEPFKFGLGQGQVIKCWDKGFATMKTGEKATFKCNAANAYGSRGSPPKIPAEATLLFDVELITHSSDKSSKSTGKQEL